MALSPIGPLYLSLGLAAALAASAALATDTSPGLAAGSGKPHLLLAEVQRAASGKMDCSPAGLSQADPRKRKMMERICARQASRDQPTYKISNAGDIASATTPPDLYQGADRAELEQLVREAWQAKWPKDQVLGIHFHAKSWKRNKTKRWNDAMSQWDYNDTSTLPVKVVVREDAEKATVFPAYVNRRNDSGEINAGVATKSSEYLVTQMLLENYGN